MKNFVTWTERSNFLRNFLRRVPKGAFHVSRATLWEKDDKSKLFCLWLLKIFAWLFFSLTKKISPGCQNHILSVQSKNLGKNFLSYMFFRIFFRYWAEELGKLAENYWQGCQNHIQCVRRNTFTATSLKQVCKHFNFSGFLLKFPWQQRKITFRVDKTAKMSRVAN